MNKKKIALIVGLIAVLLGVSFFWGENPFGKKEVETESAQQPKIEYNDSSSASGDSSNSNSNSDSESEKQPSEDEKKEEKKEQEPEQSGSEQTQPKNENPSEEKEKAEKNPTSDDKKQKESEGEKQKDEASKEQGKEQESKDKPVTPPPAEKKEEKSESKEEKQTGKDKYLTDPIPEGKPKPVEPQDAVITDKKMTASLSVRCDTLLNNMDKLNPEKVELVPKDGVIFPMTQVTFYEGESVFNVLQREMKKNKIHMAFKNTPMYNSAYIQGINNLYEFDGGNLSGWTYRVNGWFPNYGCSRYQLKQGDVIEWLYTCDLGRDVGGGQIIGADGE